MAAIVNSSVVLPVSYEKEIIRGVIGRSKALELGRRLPDMNTKTLKLNVLSQLPVAGWVSKQATPATAPGEIKDKPLGVLAWEGVDVVAEEVAVIVPIAISTLQDTEDYGVSVVPTISEQVVGAFQEVIDSAIFFGVNTPFTGNLATGLVGNANVQSVTWDGSAGTSFYEAINEAMSYVEASGYQPTAILGGPSLNSAYRGSITTLGINVADQGEIGALPRHIDLTGGFNESTAFAIVGDFRYLVYSIREGMTMRLLTEATLIDSDGTTRYNLAQQDMVAFRFTMRLGFALPNPVNRVGGATRFPFAKIVKE
jgi:hypothetical protein